MEALRLRILDIDFEYRQIIVRNGKGQKDRSVMLPEILNEPLRKQLEKVEESFLFIWRVTAKFKTKKISG